VPILFIACRTGFNPAELENDGGPYEAIPLIIFVILLGRYLWLGKRKRPANPWIMPVVALGSAAWLVAAALFGYMGWGDLPIWHFVVVLPVFWLLCLAAWQSVSLAEAGRQLVKPLPFVFAIGALFYSVFVGLDATSNAHARTYLAEQRHAAVDARAWAHENWDRPIP